MTSRAVSFVAKSANPARVAEAVATKVAAVRAPGGLLVFVSGELTAKVGEVAEALALAAPGVPTIVAAGAGVLTEAGEVEGQAAAAGVLWGGARAEIFTVEAGESGIGESLARVLGDRTARASLPAVAFIRPGALSGGSLQELVDARTTPYLVGAGTVGDTGAIAIGPDGKLATGGAVGMVLRGLARPVLGVALLIRLLGPLEPITEAHGAMVTGLSGQPALARLGEIGGKLSGRPLLLAVLAERPGPTEGRPDWLVRGIQGVDPSRGGIVVSEEVRVGMGLGFAVRDADAAREDLEALTRDVGRDLAGSAPRFGLYLNCAGRGLGLYGSHDVDVRHLRSRFRDTPIAGMSSAFEIGPHQGHPALHLYTGVLAMFASPS